MIAYISTGVGIDFFKKVFIDFYDLLDFDVDFPKNQRVKKKKNFKKSTLEQENFQKYQRVINANFKKNHLRKQEKISQTHCEKKKIFRKINI